MPSHPPTKKMSPIRETVAQHFRQWIKMQEEKLREKTHDDESRTDDYECLADRHILKTLLVLASILNMPKQFWHKCQSPVFLVRTIELLRGQTDLDPSPGGRSSSTILSTTIICTEISSKNRWKYYENAREKSSLFHVRKACFWISKTVQFVSFWSLFCLVVSEHVWGHWVNSHGESDFFDFFYEKSDSLWQFLKCNFFTKFEEISH